MKFEEVLPALRDGRRARHEYWPRGAYIQVDWVKSMPDSKNLYLYDPTTDSYARWKDYRGWILRDGWVLE